MSPLTIFAAISTLTFIAVSAIVGARLLLLSRKTRAIPEFSLGLGLFIIVAVGYPLTLIGRSQIDSTPDIARYIVAASIVPMSIGWCSVWIFTWRVFRPASRLTRNLVLFVLSLSSVLVLAGIHHTLTIPDIRNLEYGQVRFMGTTVLAMVAYVWAAVESFRYHQLMGKRVALGLADPIVANRFFLFGLVMIFSFISTGIPTTATMLGIDTVRSAPILACAAVAGLACSASLWLAFVPPRSYIRRLQTA